MCGVNFDAWLWNISTDILTRIKIDAHQSLCGRPFCDSEVLWLINHLDWSSWLQQHKRHWDHDHSFREPCRQICGNFCVVSEGKTLKKQAVEGQTGSDTFGLFVVFFFAGVGWRQTPAVHHIVLVVKASQNFCTNQCCRQPRWQTMKSDLRV